MAAHDYLRDSKKAPQVDASDLKCIEPRRSDPFQDSYCSASNGYSAPRSPRSALKGATDENEIPASTSNLPIQVVAIQIRDRLPAGAEDFLCAQTESGMSVSACTRTIPIFKGLNISLTSRRLGGPFLMRWNAPLLNRRGHTVHSRLRGH